MLEHDHTDDCEACAEEILPIEDAIKDHKLKYRYLICGYFASLAGLAACAYKLVGPYGAGMIVFLWGTYFCLSNMRAALSNLSVMHRTLGMFAGMEEAEEEEANKQHPPLGQYL